MAPKKQGVIPDDNLSCLLFAVASTQSAPFRVLRSIWRHGALRPQRPHGTKCVCTQEMRTDAGNRRIVSRFMQLYGSMWKQEGDHNSRRHASTCGRERVDADAGLHQSCSLACPS